MALIVPMILTALVAPMASWPAAGAGQEAEADRAQCGSAPRMAKEKNEEKKNRKAKTDKKAKKNRGRQRDIIGATTPEAILGHAGFSGAREKSSPGPDLARRWGAIDTPCTLVVVFGSWCGDSHRWVPDAIGLAEEPNPFVSVHWIGVPRSKKAKKADWPLQSIPQKTKRVPTFWLFAPTPGGGTRLAGSIVENPPNAGQGMAEALVELLETSL